MAGPDLLDLKIEAGQSESEIAKRVYRKLRDTPDSLLILDNVDTSEAQEAIKKLPPSGGHVLITSRLQHWSTGTRLHQVETLEPSAAAAFLLEATQNFRQPAIDDPQVAESLAEQLGYLPLALELTAAYIRVHTRSFRHLLTEWDTDLERLGGWHDPSVDYPLPLIATWSRTFEKLTLGAQALLYLLGHFAPAPLAVAILEKSEATLKKTGIPDLQAAMAELSRYCLISRPLQLGRNDLTMHRLVQEVARLRIPEAERRAWVEKALAIADKFAPLKGNDFETWPIWDHLRPHVTRVIELARVYGITDGPTASLMLKLGGC